MELIWKKRIVYNGDLIIGEANKHKTVLQYKNIDDKYWIDVELIEFE